jgi:hypothetical protein
MAVHIRQEIVILVKLFQAEQFVLFKTRNILLTKLILRHKIRQIVVVGH